MQGADSRHTGVDAEKLLEIKLRRMGFTTMAPPSVDEGSDLAVRWKNGHTWYIQVTAGSHSSGNSYQITKKEEKIRQANCKPDFIAIYIHHMDKNGETSEHWFIIPTEIYLHKRTRKYYDTRYSFKINVVPRFLRPPMDKAHNAFAQLKRPEKETQGWWISK